MNTAGPVIRARYLENEEHCLAMWDRNPKKVRLWVYVLIAFSIVGLVTLPDTFRDRAKGVRGWWVGSAVMFLLGGVITWFVSPLNQRRLFRKSISKHLTSPVTEVWWEFSEAGFMSAGRGGRNAFYPWATIPDVRQLADGLVVYLDERDYFWIPQQAFANAEDYAAVTKYAQNKAKLFQRAP